LAYPPRPGASAQVSSAQATKRFKNDLDQLLKNLKASLAEAKATFFDELEAFEDQVKADAYDVATVTDLFDVLSAMMGSIGQDVRSVGDGTNAAATQALVALAAGGDLAGVLPDGFYPGDAGLVDKLDAAVRKAQDKTVAAVAKRLKKTRTLVEKHADVGLTVILTAPGSIRDTNRSEDGSLLLGNDVGFTCDCLIAVSDLGQVEDGVIFVGGTASPGLGGVSVSLSGPESGFDVSDVPTVDLMRWSVSFVGDGMAEGTYTTAATQGTNGPLATGSIGVR